MRIVVWLVVGAVVAVVSARTHHFDFPAGRAACLVGGAAGGFLGGGVLTVAAAADGMRLLASSTATAAVGAVVVIVAVGWAGRAEYAPPGSPDGRNRSAR